MTIDAHDRSALKPGSRNALLIHRRFPGQFSPLAETLMDRADFRVFALGSDEVTGDLDPFITSRLEDIRHYPSTSTWSAVSSHHRLVEALHNSRAVARELLSWRTQGLVPDLIVSHLSWGESIHVRSIFPGATLIGYCEFFHHPEGVDAGFDPEFGDKGLEAEWNVRELNAVELLGLESMNMGLSPTRWQRDLFPAAYRPRIRVIHEGVDTERFAPNDNARFEIPGDGRFLTRKDRVLTLATSSLEPYRGIHTFIRALPAIFSRHPDCHVVIAGSGDAARYGASPRIGGLPLIEALLLENPLPRDRIHCVGFLQSDAYRSLLQVSSAHVYLTVPFVLSWSLMEAMAVGCSIVASDTAPVLEVLRDQDNALLVDFFSPDELAQRVSLILSNPADFQYLGLRARQTIQSLYERRHSKKAYEALVDELMVLRLAQPQRPFA